MASNLDKKLAEYEKQKSTTARDATPPATPIPAAPPPGVVSVFFDCMTSNYFAKNKNGEFQRYPKEELQLLLRRNGYFTSYRHTDGLSYLESEMLRTIQEESVHFAGALGGYAPGLYNIHGSRVLVTRGPVPLTPKEGRWDTLKEFFTTLLQDEAKYFYAWLKIAVTSLRRGHPWAVGQLLAVAGPPGSGKSVLQSLITPLLGGRVSSPYTYLSAGTNFNAEIYAAEHGLIGDVNHAIDPRARRNFGAAIKKLVAEPVHYLHAKGRTPITLTPFLRLTLTLNDDPQALLVLPSFDSDVQDKILLLRAWPADVEKRQKKFGDWHACYSKMTAELPAFLHAILRWRIPESIRDERYGVASFHDAELVQHLNQLSEEAKLLSVIDTYILAPGLVDHWTGSASELEKTLSEKMRPGETSRLFRYSTHCGGMLSTLAKKCSDRVTVETVGGNKKVYLIRSEPPRS